MNRRTFLAASLPLFGTYEGVSAQQNTDDVSIYVTGEYQVLRGIKSVYPLVEKLNEDVSEYGVSTDTIRNAFKDKLKTSDIKIGGEFDGSTGLLLDVTFISVAGGLFAYTCTLSAHESVRILRLRTPHIVLAATTWSTRHIGLIGTDKMKDLISIAISLVDEFAIDYKKANPKK